jgi:hypothetical protein
MSVRGSTNNATQENETVTAPHPPIHPLFHNARPPLSFLTPISPHHTLPHDTTTPTHPSIHRTHSSLELTRPSPSEARRVWLWFHRFSITSSQTSQAMKGRSAAPKIIGGRRKVGDSGFGSQCVCESVFMCGGPCRKQMGLMWCRI